MHLLLLAPFIMRPRPCATLLLPVALVLGACGSKENPSALTAHTAAADKAPACQHSLARGDAFKLPFGEVEVAVYEEGSLGSPWTTASFILKDHELRLTEAEARDALAMTLERIEKTCRHEPVERARLFLYPAGAIAGQSSAWIARLEKNKGTDVDIRWHFLKDSRNDRYACLTEMEPGRSLDIGTRLPPVQQREIVGTWAKPEFGLTMSIERVGKKAYRVYRSSHCASGDRGDRLRENAGHFYVVGSNHGDYYQVQPSGELVIFDKEGRIDVMPKHFALHPTSGPE